jgi:hypothetical protein
MSRLDSVALAPSADPTTFAEVSSSQQSHVIQSPAEPVLLAHGLLQDPGAVPLVIAVAGHRDPRPEYLPILRKNFQLQLEQLIDTLPHTPLLMLNGLAEGMDSEAAEVFLDVVDSDRSRRGALTPQHQLVGALPKTPEDYRGDFTDPNALTRLERLLLNCDGVLHPGNCPDLELDADADVDESACYGQQGVFLVRHCYLLFGFFDGIETELVGGTSQTVSMQKGEIHPLFVSVDEVLANKEPGALVVHHTPRLKIGSPHESPGATRFWCGASTTKTRSPLDGIHLPQNLLVIPARIESINAALTKPGFESTCYNAAEGRFTRLWSLADRKASQSKFRYERWCRFLVITGFVLVLLAQLSPIAQGLWWALLLLAFVLFPKLQQGPKHEFIAQRCLAECLTVQHLWIALDIDDDAADLFHSRSNSDLGWIRTILRAVRVQLLSFHASEPRVYGNAIFKAQIWIDEQVSFLSKRVLQFLKIAARWRTLALALAGSAIVLATVQSFPDSNAQLASWVVVLLAGFASALAYSNLIGYAETADRYQRSLRQFERGQLGLALLERKQADEPSRVHLRQRIVIEALGREKLDELNDWVAGQLQRVYAPGA